MQKLLQGDGEQQLLGVGLGPVWPGAGDALCSRNGRCAPNSDGAALSASSLRQGAIDESTDRSMPSKE